MTLIIEREHQRINELFARLEAVHVDSSAFDELWSDIAGLLRDDVRDEEDRLLPGLQDTLSASALTRLGWAWKAVRRVSPTRPHPTVSRRPPGNALAAAPLTLIDRARDRLDDLARRSSAPLRSTTTALNGALAGLAGRVERFPLFTRGEHPVTSVADQAHTDER